MISILGVILALLGILLAVVVLLALLLNTPRVVSDYFSVFQRDPAARGFWGYIEVLSTYAGFHAIVAYRVAHSLLKLHIPFVPRLISQIARFVTGVEIHPGAEIGRGFFIDHGMGVVIGETTIVGDDCTLFQGVTLGGTGKEKGKRHPTLGSNVMVSAGAKVLGNIEIGDNVRIGAGSVVLKPVPSDCTVVGIPGHVVRRKGKRVVADLEHGKLPDPISERFAILQKELECLEEKIDCVEKDCELRKKAHQFDSEPYESESEEESS